MSKILLKRSVVTATPPSLDVGEMAWSELNGGKLFIGESGSQVSLVADAGSQANTVDSVNGEVGVVVLNTGHISESGNLYYTDTRANAAPDVVSNTTHRGLTNNPHSVTKSQIGLTDVQDIKSNFAGTVAPGVSDDNTSGYSVGSVWVDTVADKSYTASDVSTGAAVWLFTSATEATFPLSAPDGTVAAPSYTFSSHSDTSGMYINGSSGIAISHTGTEMLALESNRCFISRKITMDENGTSSSPSYTFVDDPASGMYSPSGNNLGFVSGSEQRFLISNTGVLSTGATVDYETLVTLDDHIPNKKYVDDAITAGAGATQLDELSDVVSATNTASFALLANGTTGYVGRAIVEADVSNLQSYILASGVTYENLDANSDVGSGASQVAQGSHLHTATYVALAGSVMTSAADITFSGSGEVLGLPASPSGATAATSKAYVDAQVAAVASGVDPKDSVRAVSQGANLTLSGAQTVDGVSLIAGDRILVKDQTAGQDNGIYDVAVASWVRSSDADTSAEVTSGQYCFVTEGTVGNNQGWILNTPDPIVLDTTVLDYVLFTGTGQIIAGDGIVKTGSTLSTDIDNTSLIFTAGEMSVNIVDGGTF